MTKPGIALSRKYLPPDGSLGVTLVEMLVVVAVAVSLMGMILPAFSNIQQSGRLVTAGNQTSELADLARQNSLSKNCLTALVLITDSTASRSRQAFAILQMIPPEVSVSGTSQAAWQQISSLHTLDSGIFVDVTLPASNTQPINASCTFQDGPSQNFASVTSLPRTFSYEGDTVSTYKFVVFLSNGSLLCGSPARVELAEGCLTGGSSPTAVYVQPLPNSNSPAPADYYRVTLLAATGRVKIDRP